MDDFLDDLIRWMFNIGWVLVSCGIFYLIFHDVTISALLTIALSDLYIK